MDESLRESTRSDDWRAVLTTTMDQQRQCLGERLASQRQRCELEERVAVQIDEVTQELSRRED